MPKQIKKTRKKIPCTQLQGNKKKNNNDIYEEEDTIVKSPYMRVCEANKILKGEILPTNFKFRGKEAEEIEGKILSLMSNKKLLCKVVMISGSPGAGKTMTTNSILQKLESVKGYKIISLNANKIKQRQVQKMLIYELLPDQPELQSQPTFRIIQALQKNSNNLPPTILYIEQVQLFFKCPKQELSQDLFDIFINKKINILFLGISNTVDTLQQYCTKMGKVNAKDVVNVVFNPYTIQQLKDIILGKLREVEEVLGIQVKIQDKLARFIANKIDEEKKGDMRMTFEFLTDLSHLILPQDPSTQYCLPQKITITPQLVSQVFQKKRVSKPSFLSSFPTSSQITLLSAYLWLKQNDDISIPYNCLIKKVNEIYSNLKLPIKDNLYQQITYLTNYSVINERKKVEKIGKAAKDSKEGKEGVQQKQCVRYLLNMGFDQIKTFFLKNPILSKFV